MKFTFGFLETIAYYTPESWNDLFSWEFYQRFKDPVTYNIPIIGENPARATTHIHWHRRIDYNRKRTAGYQLMEAICEDDIGKVEELLDSGFNLTTKICHERNYDAMNLAAVLNRVQIIKYLILRGGLLEFRDNEGNTPLLNAVKNWQFESIKTLVDYGAKTEIVDKFGKSPAQGARERNLESISQFFETLDSQNHLKVGTASGTIKLPPFGVKLDFEQMYDHERKNPLLSKSVALSEGSYYPFNSLKGSYLLDAISFQKIDC